ncbi:MAG: TIGR00701 family protein [Gammaproteobacteria bacterium]|nr:TIGR00701 family protein [Gammaproteobacteria bacterium]
MMLLKTLHIIFMTAWFAGLFYLPRLFVYHAMAEDKLSLDRFVIMERKLLYGIMTPSAVLTVVFGIFLTYIYLPVYLNQTWLALKFILVVILIFYHIWCINLYKDFSKNKNKHSHVWYRWFNEFPVITLILITVLVIYKPFS